MHTLRFWLAGIVSLDQVSVIQLMFLAASRGVLRIIALMPRERMDRELLQAALVGLERRRNDLAEKISEVRRMLGGRAGPDSAVTNVSPAPMGRRRRMSAAGRARIAEAQH